jgi:hypothetical protein
MRLAPVVATIILLFGATSAHARDLASEPAYPMQGEAPKVKAKAAAKPAAAKPEPRTNAAKTEAPKTEDTKKPTDVKLPTARPTTTAAATPEVKVEAKADPQPKIAPAKTEPPKMTTASAPMPDSSFGKLPADERAAIRSALLWSSGEDGKAGDRDDPMAAAIKAYQKRNKSKITGILTDSEKSELLAAAKTHYDEFGWSVVVDPVTGIRLGIPGKLASQVSEAKDGTRWTSRHGDVVIESFRIKTKENLNALFETQKKEPANRKVETSYARNDNFFVGGLQGLKHFAVRAHLKNGELRGYTMLYDQAMATIVMPVLPAMANAFAPFPDGPAPMAPLSRPVGYGTGVVVSENGYIVTDRRFADGCDVINVPGIGNAERIALDETHGLGLLRVYGKQKLQPAALAPDNAPRDIKLVGVPDPHTQNGDSRRSTLSAQLSDNNAIRLRDSVPLAGLSGAAALDGKGRVLGIMEMGGMRPVGGMQLASAQPSTPPVRLIPSSAIRNFLAAHNVTPSAGDGGESAIVRVICVRQ